MGKLTLWGMIDAQPVYFPAAAQDLNAAILVFAVPADAARGLVEGEAFEVAEPHPGLAHLVISALEVRRGDWGPSNTLDIGLQVRPVGVPDAVSGLYISPGPMSPGLGREVTHRALGLPRTSGDIDVSYTDDEATFRLTIDGTPAVTLHTPRIAPSVGPAPVDMLFYTYHDGRPHAAPFEVMLPVAIIEPETVRVELGTGPLADTLRGLGLPRPPEFTVWAEGVSAVFHQPEAVSLDGHEPT